MRLLLQLVGAIPKYLARWIYCCRLRFRVVGVASPAKRICKKGLKRSGGDGSERRNYESRPFYGWGHMWVIQSTHMQVS